MGYVFEKGSMYTLLYLLIVFIILTVQNFEGQYLLLAICSLLYLTMPVNQLHRFGRRNDRNALLNAPMSYITCNRMLETVINIQI